VAVLYLGLNLVFIYSTSLEKMKGVMAIGALSASNLFGPGIAGVFAALMAASIMATVNAMVTIGPRVYYAMALRRAFFPAAAQVHPRWRTPVIAILAQGLCAIAMTLTPFPDLMVFIGMSLTFFHGDGGGEHLRVPAAAGVDAPARGELLLSASCRCPTFW